MHFLLQKQGSCYGCGARIQTEEPGSVGYVDSATFEAKAKHRQMEQLFCRFASWLKTCCPAMSFVLANALKSGMRKRQNTLES